MSAQPVPPHRKSRASSQSTANFVTALRTEAEARAALLSSDQRIDRAVSAGAEELDYWWPTADDREAHFCIYYSVSGEDIQIPAVQLVEIDYRPPTPQERVALENLFDAELKECGDVWLAVTSRIWSK